MPLLQVKGNIVGRFCLSNYVVKSVYYIKHLI